VGGGKVEGHLDQGRIGRAKQELLRLTSGQKKDFFRVGHLDHNANLALGEESEKVKKAPIT